MCYYNDVTIHVKNSVIYFSYVEISTLFSEAVMGRKLKFDMRKCSSQKASGKTRSTGNDVKVLSQHAPTMVDAETQTDYQWFCNDKEMQTEQDWDAVSVGTQTELQVVKSVNQESAAGNEKIRGAVRE